MVCLTPQPSDWGGSSRPPAVVFAYVSAVGLHIELLSSEGQERGEPEFEALVYKAAQIEIGVPVLCVMEVHAGPPYTRLRLCLGTGDPELLFSFGEQYDHEVHLCPAKRRGDATFFDCALQYLTIDPIEQAAGQGSDSDNSWSPDQAAGLDVRPAREAARDAPQPSGANDRAASSSASGNLCNQQ